MCMVYKESIWAKLFCKHQEKNLFIWIIGKKNVLLVTYDCTALEFHLWSNSSYFVLLMNGILCWWPMLLAIKYYCSLLPIMSFHILYIYFTATCMIICYATLPWNSLKQCTTIIHEMCFVTWNFCLHTFSYLPHCICYLWLVCFSW